MGYDVTHDVRLPYQLDMMNNGGSKKLYPCFGRRLCQHSIYQKWMGEQGMTNSGFGFWITGQLECVLGL